MLHYLISPKYFYQLANQLIPIAWIICLFAFSYGLIDGLIFAPADYQQGEAYRIIYIHVPCAVLSLSVFMIMAIAAVVYLIWKIKLADIIAKVSAPIGASFTLLALLTGALWGKPMWGTWWIWDARLTAELILLFIYMAIILVRSAIQNTDAAGRAAGILTLVGIIDIPIVHYSVNWWNTLHQKASLLQFAKPTLDPSMLVPLLAMLVAFFAYYVALLLMKSRHELMLREAEARRIQSLLSHTRSKINHAASS